MKHIVSELVLPNGCRGLLIDISEASVMSFMFNFRAGEFLVPQDKWETPHLMEHLLLGANKNFPRARDYQAEFEKNGAYNNASTSIYDVTYESECADFEWSRILDLLLMAVTSPLFLESEFKAESGNVREELVGRSNNHFRHLGISLRINYGLIGKTDQERLKLIHNVTLEDIQEHYKKTHKTNNLRFIIGGNLTPKRRERIEQLLGNIDLPKGNSRYLLPNEQPHALVEPLYIRNRTVDNIYFYVDTFIRSRLNDPEVDAIDLLNIILTETLYSKIYGTAREQGLVYDMSSGYSQFRDASNWWFGTQVTTEHAPDLINIMTTELKNIFNAKLAVSDIEAAQAYALGHFQRSAQTVLGTMRSYAGRYFFDDKIEDYDMVPKRIRAVTKTAIIDVAHKMFAEKIWGFGVLGNCGIDIVRELYEQLAPLWD
ncbi:MAG: pitrilysin family protein [Candidatus Saccharimonadales bacterium]|jgi:predicted Zn-dependent peptidase